MKWSDEYATGIDRIDNQHKMIFRMTEDFQTALHEGSGESTYDTFLDFLGSYCRAHFDFEERCMDEYNCPVAQRNKEAHAGFANILSEYQHRYAAKGFNRADAHNLMNTIDQWLSKHICRIDVHLKQCVQTRSPRREG